VIKEITKPDGPQSSRSKTSLPSSRSPSRRSRSIRRELKSLPEIPENHSAAHVNPELPYSQQLRQLLDNKNRLDDVQRLAYEETKKSLNLRRVMHTAGTNSPLKGHYSQPIMNTPLENDASIQRVHVQEEPRDSVDVDAFYKTRSRESSDNYVY